MRILIYGAGVIGTLYGVKLSLAGHDVVVLARGRRLRDITVSGLVIEDVVTGARQAIQVPSIGSLAPDDAYDLVVVPVRRDHLDRVVESLATSRATPTVLFFGNNAQGAGALIEQLGGARVVLGFPGAGGQLVGATVRSLLIRAQFTTLGEVDGGRSQRLRRLGRCFRGAGFPIAISPDMQSWLKTHAAFVTCVSAAVYAAGGAARSVASSDALLTLMVRAVKEAFRILRNAGIREIPWNLRILHEVMPELFAVHYWRKAFLGPLGQFSFAAHSNTARDEMELLAADVWRLVHDDSALNLTFSFDRLFRDARFACATSDACPSRVP